MEKVLQSQKVLCRHACAYNHPNSQNEINSFGSLLNFVNWIALPKSSVFGLSHRE